MATRSPPRWRPHPAAAAHSARVLRRLVVAAAVCFLTSSLPGGTALEPPSCESKAGSMLRGIGALRHHQYHTQTPIVQGPGGSRVQDKMHAPPKMDGLASGHVDGWFDVKESYGKTKLAASMTPRAAQRERELAASPTQLSPASPVTEEDSSVLHRVNRAVSAANWEEEARLSAAAATEEAADRRIKMADAKNEETVAISGLAKSEEAVTIERLTVFNTPLPPGARVRQALHQADEEPPASLHHSDPQVKRLYELAMKQKSQLEDMLAVQRSLNSTSSTHQLRTRASRPRVPKPIVKVNLTERSLSMGLDSREVSQDEGGSGNTRAHTHTHVPTSARYGMPDRGAAARMPEKLDNIALPELKSGLSSLRDQYEDALEGLGFRGDKAKAAQERGGVDEGAHAACEHRLSKEASQDMASQECSSGDPGVFLKALDAHCEGLRAALAGVERDLQEESKRPCAEERAAGAPYAVPAGQRRQRGGEGVGEEDGRHSLEEEPRHNQCFSPLPTASPSVDRLAMEMSPLTSVPVVEQLLQQHTQHTRLQTPPLDQGAQCQKIATQGREQQKRQPQHDDALLHAAAARYEPRGARRRRSSQHNQPEWVLEAQVRARQIAASPSLAVVEIAMGVLSLVAAAVSRLVGASLGGPGLLAAANLAVGTVLLLRSCSPLHPRASSPLAPPA